MIADVPTTPPHSLHIEGDYVHHDSTIVYQCTGDNIRVVTDKNGVTRSHRVYCHQGAIERLVNSLL